MTVSALGVQQASLWQIALAVGGVVVVAVIALLGLLLYLLKSVDRGARELQGLAQRITERTHRLHELDVLRSSVQELGQEAQRHAELFGSRGVGR